MTNWTLPERHLTGELSVGIARRLFAILTFSDEGEGQIPDGYVSHCHASDFEHACYILWRLGAAYGANRDEPDHRDLCFQAHGDKGFPRYFRFLPAAEIRRLFAGALPEPVPSISEIVSTYISVACAYGQDGSWLSSSRDPFVPQYEYAGETNLLEQWGYLERRGMSMVWTDKIASAMQEARLWHYDGQSVLEVIEARLEETCEESVNQLAEHTRRLLSREAKRLTAWQFSILLTEQFDGLFVNKGLDGKKFKELYERRLFVSVYNYLREHS